MEQTKTLYYQIYEDFLSDIFTGKFKKHDCLPNLDELCDTYCVGRNTARKAMSMLATDGFVSSARGKPTTVEFDCENPVHFDLFNAFMLKRKQAIPDVFETMALVMPEITVFCLQACGIKGLLGVGQALREFQADPHIQTEGWLNDKLIGLYRYLFSFSNNPLIIDLLMNMLSFVRVPLSASQSTSKRYRESLKEIKSILFGLFKHAVTRNYSELKSSIQQFCYYGSRMVQNYLERVENQSKINEPCGFIWFVSREQEYLYAGMVIDILRLINNGVYKLGDPLPSYANLAKQYHCSIRTSIKGVSVLSDLKIVQTVNGKGSEIVLHPQKALLEMANNQFVRDNMESYLRALHLMALICKPVLLRAAPTLDKKHVRTCKESAKVNKNHKIIPIINLIFCSTGLEPFLVIYKQLVKTVQWGAFFELLAGEYMPNEQFINVETAFYDCILQDKFDQAAEELYQLFSAGFHYLKDQMRKLGFDTELNI